MFVPPPIARRIDALRRQFNPVQANLIAPHVTLCRDDEVLPWGGIQSHVQKLAGECVQLDFGAPHKEGSGVYLPAVKGVEAFHQLRRLVLKDSECRLQTPHITLVHPRNGTCSDADFEVISRECKDLDLSITFSEVALIQQSGDQPWNTVLSVPLGPE